MKFECTYTQLVSVDSLLLIQNPKNANNHSKDQIDRLAKIINFAGQRSPIVVSKRSGFIVKGHGRLMALHKLGWKEAAVDYQDYDTEACEYQDMVADNEIARWAEFDSEKFIEEIANIDIGDIDLFGLKEIPDLLSTDAESLDESSYTRKIEIPIYKPMMDSPPALKEVFDNSKSSELISKINSSTLSDELKEFLRFASYRHVKFNYKLIAELYAHQEKEAQDLFEQSALVLIDFDKAIENGFVSMTKAMEAALNEN